MEINASRLKKYSGITLGIVLVAAFVLLQPTMQQANAVSIAGLPDYDNCTFNSNAGTEMDTVRKGDIAKTIHLEKEIFNCFLVQGSLPVLVDVLMFVEVYENITAMEVVKTSVVVATCIKDGNLGGNNNGADIIDCESYEPSSSPVPVGNRCAPPSSIGLNMDGNSVRHRNIVKTPTVEKEFSLCLLPDGTQKKVDILLFVDVFENINTMETEAVLFYKMRCVVLVTDNDPDTNTPEDRDARVESCVFSSILN